MSSYLLFNCRVIWEENTNILTFIRHPVDLDSQIFHMSTVEYELWFTIFSLQLALKLISFLQCHASCLWLVNKVIVKPLGLNLVKHVLNLFLIDLTYNFHILNAKLSKALNYILFGVIFDLFAFAILDDACHLLYDCLFVLAWIGGAVRHV